MMNTKTTATLADAVSELAGFYMSTGFADAHAVSTLCAIAHHGAIDAEDVNIARTCAGKSPMADESARVVASRWSAAARLASVIGPEAACEVIRATAQALRGRFLGDALPAAIGKAAKEAKAAKAAGAKPRDLPAKAAAAAVPAAQESAARTAASKSASAAKRKAAAPGKAATAPAAAPAVKVKGEGYADALAALRPVAEAMLARVGAAQLAPEDASHAARLREVLADLEALLSRGKATPAGKA